MLNLNPDKAVSFTQEEALAIKQLIDNRGSKKGEELWEEKGGNEIFVGIKKKIQRHLLDVQKVRCAYCERILGHGEVQIEHFAPKWKFPQFLYEPLNLVCSCNICNGFPQKGKRITIKGDVAQKYIENEFKYVHPFLDDVDNEIKYRTIFRIKIDYDHCSDKGKATVDMFHWNTLHAEKKRFQNLLVWTTSSERRKMIAEILDYKD